jgi:hypothetical protein
MMPLKSFRIEGNVKPNNFDTAEFGWFAHSNQNGISYSDGETGRILFRGRAGVSVVDHVFFHITKQGRNAGKVVSAKADLSTISSYAIRALQDDIIGSVDSSANQSDLAVRPDFVLLHNIVLSDGVPNSPPSDAKAGGASSSTREGGDL